MRAADSLLLSIGWALAACSQAPQQASNNAAAIDIEALPPDETVEAPATELLNAEGPSNADAEQR